MQESLEQQRHKLEKHLFTDAQGLTRASFYQYSFGSVFQPIYCYQPNQKLEIFGYEALARPTLGELIIRPQDFLSSFTHQRYLLDRLTRVVHIRNFIHSKFHLLPNRPKLFLNFDPECYNNIGEMLSAFQLFKRRLLEIGLEPSHLVAELIESKELDNKHLITTIDSIRNTGFSLAVDDFGVEHSNIDRVLKIRPDLVKFDRSWLVKSAQSERKTQEFIESVHTIRSLGIKVLIEGVEFDYDAELCTRLNPDFVQGFLYALPDVLPPSQQKEYKSQSMQ